MSASWVDPDPNSDSAWHAPPAKLSLLSRRVHIWRVHWRVLGAQVSNLRALLSKDEVVRAARYRFELPRSRFIITRGVFRLILAAYLGVSPQSLRFDYTEYGKPFLSSSDFPNLNFNLSHSEDIALIALTRGMPVGIDVECVREISNLEYLVERCFSLAEAHTFRNLPAKERRDAFFRAWTCKEAYMKARGKGFALPLNRFEVSFMPGVPARLLCDRDHPGESDDWSLWNLIPMPGYIGALAVYQRCASLSCALLESLRDPLQSAAPSGVLDLWQWVKPSLGFMSFPPSSG